MPDAPAPRIALVFNGDTLDPTAWSGTPFGLHRGLEAAGVEVVAVDARLPGGAERLMGGLLGVRMAPRAQEPTRSGRLRSGYSAALIGPEVAGARSLLLRRRLRAQELAGIVQIGTGFLPPLRAPVVTYEDMTIRQALQYPYRHWRTLTPGQVARRIAVQERCYARARAVVMTNSWAAASARAEYGIAADRVHVAGVGSHEEQRTVARSWAVPRFLFVGLDWERKNGPRVLRAFAEVRRVHPDAELHVVGGHPLLDAPGVTGHGRLRRDEPEGRAALRRLFDAATCFVMPSLFEPSAVVYTEASACGLPAIGTTVGGSEDLVGDGGTSVDPEDDDALRAAMLALAEPAHAERVGRRAAERAPLFTWQAVAERLLRALDPALLGRPLAQYL